MKIPMICIASILLAVQSAPAAAPDYSRAPIAGKGVVTSMPQPDVPYEVRSRGRGGWMWLGFTVGKDGTPENIQVVSTTASPVMTKWFVGWLKTCKARPASAGKMFKIRVGAGQPHELRQ